MLIQPLEIVQRWAAMAPDRVAHQVASAGATSTLRSTYGELIERAAAVAHHLRDSRTEAPVIVLGHKEPEMLAGFLGALESGRAYIPLDDSLPPHRVEAIARMAEACAILRPQQIAALPASGATTLRRAMAPDDPVYIIFTSGSTGEPKGVLITAGNLTAFVEWMLSEHSFEPGHETFLNQAPFSFDLSVMDLYLSLTTGSRLFSITKRELSNFRALYRNFAEAGLTSWVSTPSFVQMCLAEKTFDATRLPRLRRFLFCGETLLPETADRLLKRFPGAEVWNTYGPTEATVATTSIRVNAEMVESGGPLPIGFARPGTDVLLQDESGDEAVPGERGEIVIAGDNVSPGYLNRPDLTGHSFGTLNGKRAYRTGDWGRKIEGLLYCEGRRDLQLKLNGHRIELADIEANLCALNGVRDCVVSAVRTEDGVKSLTAFVAAENETADGLRKALAERVPPYMIPRKFVLLPFLPLTPNGKADRKQLDAMANPA